MLPPRGVLWVGHPGTVSLWPGSDTRKSGEWVPVYAPKVDLKSFPEDVSNQERKTLLDGVGAMVTAGECTGSFPGLCHCGISGDTLMLQGSQARSQQGTMASAVRAAHWPPLSPVSWVLVCIYCSPATILPRNLLSFNDLLLLCLIANITCIC